MGLVGRLISIVTRPIRSWKLKTVTTEANGQSKPGIPEEFDPSDHRAFIRQINKSLALAYGFGGGAVLLGVAVLLVVAWWVGWIWSPLTWLAAVVGALIGMLVVRMVVYRRVDRLYDRLRSYCEANDVEPAVLRAHYDDDQLYPYFQALFELKERRKRLDRGDTIEETPADAE